MFIPTFNSDGKIISYINSMNIYKFYVYSVCEGEDVDFFVECLVKSSDGFDERPISRITKDYNEACHWMENLSVNLNKCLYI